MSITDHKPMPEGEFVRAPGVEVFTGAGHRRSWTVDEKAAIVAESFASSSSVSQVARRHGLTPSQLFTWRREARLQSSEADNPGFVPAVVDRPDAVQRPPVIELDLGGDSVWIWGGADAAIVTAVIGALKKSHRPHPT
jgi:transposase